MILYTIGNIKDYDGKATHKDTGGSVWLTQEGAAVYIDRITQNGVRVQGGVYEVLVEGDDLLEDFCTLGKGSWFTLTKPVPLGKRVQLGAPVEQEDLC